MPGIVIQIQGDGAGAAEALRLVQEEMHRTREATEEAENGMAEFGERVKRALEFSGIYLGIRELKDGLQELVMKTMENAEELEHLSQQTGVTAANLSVLKFAAQSSGISFEVMTTGFRKLSTAMIEADSGMKQSQRAFEWLGISQEQVKAHTNDLWGMLGILADRFKTMPDGALKSAAATELLGRAGTQLIPILNQGAEGLQDFKDKAGSLGVILDEQGIAKLEQMKRGLAELQAAAEGAGIQFTEGLAPGVGAAAAALSHATDAGKGFATVGEQVGREALSMAAQFAWLVEWNQRLGAEMNEIQGVLYAVGDALLYALNPVASGKAYSLKLFKQDQEEINAAAQQNKSAIADYQRTKDELAKAMANYGNTVAEAKSAGGAGPDISGGGKGAKAKVSQGDGGIDRARTSLAEAMAAQETAAVKAATEAGLAALDEQHKQFLVSDAAYYADKLKLQDKALDAQIAALQKQASELQALEARQHADPKQHRDASGQNAAELGTARQVLEIQGKIAEVEAQKVKAAEQYKAAEAAATNAGQLEILKQAAQIETERNTGITARLALLRQENELELQKAAVNYGAGSPQYAQVQQLGQIAEAKLRIGALDQQIADSEKSNQIQTQAIQDELNRKLITKKEAQTEINKLNKEEAELLKQILPMYKQEADYLGGGAKDKSQELQKQIGDLSSPAQKGKGSNPGEELTKSLTGSLEQMTQAALKGKASFSDLADSVISDITRMAAKILEEKLLTKLFGGGDDSGGFGGGDSSGGFGSLFAGLPGFAAGGRPSGPSIVGEQGPELFVPDGAGTVINNSTLKQMSSGGGQSPNVTMNITNNSSSSVSAKETGRSYDYESKQFIVHTVLEDLHSGGSISGALGGMSGR